MQKYLRAATNLPRDFLLQAERAGKEKMQCRCRGGQCEMLYGCTVDMLYKPIRCISRNRELESLLRGRRAGASRPMKWTQRVEGAIGGLNELVCWLGKSFASLGERREKPAGYHLGRECTADLTRGTPWEERRLHRHLEDCVVGHRAMCWVKPAFGGCIADIL